VRLLLITAMWPTQDHPASGSFVVDRVGAVPGITVVSQTRTREWWLAGYAQLAIDAVRARGAFDGIEAHPVYPAGLIGLVLARLRRLPLVVYAHGTDVRTAHAVGGCRCRGDQFRR